MKTSVGALVLLGAVMTAGLALAQTPPPARGAPAAAEPGQTRATVSQSGAILATERAAPVCTPDSAGGALRSGAAATPVNGVGGQGGGRYARGRMINNSETDNSATPDRAGETSNRDHIDQDAQAEIRTRRSSPANPTGPGAGEPAAGLSYTTGDFTAPQMLRAGDPRGPGADDPAPAAPACAPTPGVRR
ncbi:MAG: hypothetical protein PSV23_11180 [Brevundimonas sp.]|uniref:hypothetical protein n=1 Tax=Brevundimonas sp. TaxID=1871086 RepID=UPI00248700E8|nr:hypothetical protein [Brevundimonas sp.]MDI1327348.1 hypothetical protein [Brevundimonas sp.]